MYTINRCSMEAEQVRKPYIDFRLKEWRNRPDFNNKLRIRSPLPFKECGILQSFNVPFWQMSHNQLRLAKGAMMRLNRRYKVFFAVVVHDHHYEFVRLI